MSGITKYVIKPLSLIGLVYFTLLSSTAGAVEKSAKSRLINSTQKEQQSVERLESDTAQSILSTQREANYKDISDPGLILEKMSSSGEKVPGINKSVAKIRDPELSAKLKSSAFYFSSVDVFMHSDPDYDGYYSEFSVNFDADTDYNSATVYALFYLSYEGGPWELYYETDYVNLYGWSSTDDLTVTTLLTSGYPPGRYDILIDLYDEYDNSLVATISSYDTYALADLYLEDTGYEGDSGTYSQFSIYDASVTLLNDDDGDGFYHKFSLQFDADVSSGDALVYAEIWVRDSSGGWQLDYTTADFLIDGNSTLDTFIMETVWESGYSTGYYDFRIELYDAITDVLLTTSVEQNQQLSAVPLEDTSLDVYSSPGSSGGSSTSVSYESGGGSMGLLLPIIFLISRLFRSGHA